MNNLEERLSKGNLIKSNVSVSTVEVTAAGSTKVKTMFCGMG